HNGKRCLYTRAG
ncbi:hypothetical protein EC5905_2065, partial [Escherichia coli 5905]